MLVRVCGANHRPTGDHPPRCSRLVVGFACGKLHSYRMPDKQCFSLQRHKRSVQRRAFSYSVTRKACRDEHCSSAFAEQTIARRAIIPCVAAGWYDGFACGKLHSYRMPDKQCLSLQRHKRRVQGRASSYSVTREVCKDELFPTASQEKRVGTSIARPPMRNRVSNQADKRCSQTKQFRSLKK